MQRRMKRGNGNGHVTALPSPKLETAPERNTPTIEALKAGAVDWEWKGIRGIGRYVTAMRVDVGGSVTAGGVIIPDALQMPAWVAVAVGPDVVGVQQWDRILMIVKQPDVVFINHKGHDFCIVPFELLCCVLPMPPSATEQPRIVLTNQHGMNRAS